MGSNEEIEIDLIRLGRYILSKWMIILFSCVVFACIGFSYKFFAFKYSAVPLEELDKQFKIVRAEKQPDGRIQQKDYKVSYRMYKDDYETRLAEYKSNLNRYELDKKNISEQMEVVQSKIDEQKEYMRDSLLFSTDDVYDQVLFYTIQDKEKKEELVKTDNSAVSFAFSFLKSSNFMLELARKIGMDLEGRKTLRAVEELIQVEKKNNDSFSVRLLADSEEHVEKISTLLESFNKALYLFSNERYSIVIQKISEGKAMPLEFVQLKNNAKQRLNDLECELNDIKVKSSAILEPIRFEDYGKLVNLETFKIMKLIKFAIIGLLFGFVVSVGCFIGKYLLAGKLRDSNYISDCFNINKISCIHDLGKKANESAVKALFENLKYIIAAGNSSIIMLSTMMGTYEQQLSEIKTIIDNFNSENGTDIKFVGPESINEINSADEVILAEKLDISDLNSVIDEVKTVLTVKKKVYGIVYI